MLENLQYLPQRNRNSPHSLNLSSVVTTSLHLHLAVDQCNKLYAKRLDCFESLCDGQEYARFQLVMLHCNLVAQVFKICRENKFQYHKKTKSEYAADVHLHKLVSRMQIALS